MSDDDVASAFAGLTSGALSGFGSIWSASSTRSNARYQAALQLTNMYKAAQNLPAFQRQGLESAGYNPLLALGNSASNASSAIQVAGSDMSGLSGVGDAVESLVDKKQEKHEQEQKDKLFNAQLKQIEATINNINTHSAQRRLENKIIEDKIKSYNDSDNWFSPKTWSDKLNRAKNAIADWWSDGRRQSAMQYARANYPFVKY